MRAHGLIVIAASTGDDPGLELSAINTPLGRRLDGLIISTIRDERSLLAREIQWG